MFFLYSFAVFPFFVSRLYLITSDFADVVNTDGVLDIGIVFVDYVFNFVRVPLCR